MPEGKIKNLTDKNFGFIKSETDKDLSSMHRPFEV
jgi:hypothetical protein